MVADTVQSAEEQELRAALRRHRQRTKAAAEAERERDEAIRAAIEGGMPRWRVIAITELSPQRIDQIRRAKRV